jgi:hypothetical protein
MQMHKIYESNYWAVSSYVPIIFMSMLLKV